MKPSETEKTTMTFDESKLKDDIDDVNCEATFRSTIRMDDTVLVPAVVYKFLTSHLEKTSMGSLMTMIQESKDLDRLTNFFRVQLMKHSERAECGIMVAYQDEMEMMTGITKDSPIYELAILMFYHIRDLKEPDELDYLYKYH